MSKLSPEEAIGLAYSLYDQKRLGEVENVCRTVLRASPEQFDTLYLLGLCECHRGNAATGARLIKQACAVNPGINNYDHMSALLHQQGVRNMANIWKTKLREYHKINAIDAFLLSYPKCGRTWLRLMLGRYALAGRPGDPLKLLTITRQSPELPTMEVSHDDYPHWKPFTNLFENKEMYRDKMVVLLVRDPRDVLVSYYFQYVKRGDKDLANDRDFRGDLSDFIRHDIGGVRSLVKFYNIWAKNRRIPARFNLITYENLHADTRGVLVDLLRFLGWPDRGSRVLDDTISFGRFDNMRKLEETNALNNPRLLPPEDGDPEGFKIRRGKVGGYTDYLNPDDIDFINSFMNSELDDFYHMYKDTH